MVPGEHHVERNDQTGLRQHLDADHEQDEELAAAEAVARECHRREKREHDRDRDGDADHDQAVLDVLPEVRTVDRIAEVLERRMQREPGRPERDDLVVRLECGRDHPEDREDHDHEHDEADRVPAGLPRAATAPSGHSCTPMRTILRT